MDKQNDETMVEYLFRTAAYAINSKSLHLVYQVYGEVCMAYRLEFLTWEDFSKLHTMLVRDVMSNGRLTNEWDRERRECGACPFKRALESVIDARFEEVRHG